ncbi:suppressor of G2 allele of skp1 [Megalopta genalis]|uniref:suppressor of G2 allele of skp1 n=1 Tax=Megalopta genalis TaxID=115081 RepID=UPI003FD6099B
MASEESSTQNDNTAEIVRKIRYEWYQTETHVIVMILAKNTRNVNVDMNENSLRVSALLPQSDYNLELNLAHPVVPEHCTFKVSPSKIEIKLKKESGITWTTLKGDPVAEAKVQSIPQEILQASAQPSKYPTSCAKTRDWNKLEKEIEKQEAEENVEGEAAVNALFQRIYSQGSDEVRRAMNKSFQESGGTVLSTNWSNVGKGKVERKLPDGMEWKPWNT